ncbi:mCG14587, isoform CRA_b, partial [Mus musculus]
VLKPVLRAEGFHESRLDLEALSDPDTCSSSSCSQKSPAWHQAPRKDVKTNHVSPSFLATICLMAVKPSRILNGWRLPAGLLSSSFAYASCQAPKKSSVHV